MTGTVVSRSVFPVVRGLLALLIALAVVVPLVLLLLAVETEPRVRDAGPPDAAAAAHTRVFADRVRLVIDTDAADGTVSADEAELNAVLAAAQRLLPGTRGQAHVGNDVVTIELSAGAPLVPFDLWLNVGVAVAASEDGLRIASARVGRLPLPPGLAMLGLRAGLNRLLGQDLGTEALDGVAGLRLAAPRVTVALDFPPEERSAFFARLRERSLRSAGEGAPARIMGYLEEMQAAAEAGVLPRRGSVLDYVRFAIEAASARGGAGADEIKAALYALALYCGDAEIGQSLGIALDTRFRGSSNGCSATTLAGRDDLKRHYVISAGLYGVAAGKATFGMGELKELLDSNLGGSGFSFDDMAADAAGVRLAETLLASPSGDWQGIVAILGDEADILPPLDGLPSGLSEAEFRRRYSDVDSPEYAALVAEIRRRIDALPVSVAPTPG